MPHVEYEHLSDEVQNQIATLEIKVMDLEGDMRFYRWGAIVGFFVLFERIWDRLF